MRPAASSSSTRAPAALERRELHGAPSTGGDEWKPRRARPRSVLASTWPAQRASSCAGKSSRQCDPAGLLTQARCLGQAALIVSRLVALPTRVPISRCRRAGRVRRRGRRPSAGAARPPALSSLSCRSGRRGIDHPGRRSSATFGVRPDSAAALRRCAGETSLEQRVGRKPVGAVHPSSHSPVGTGPDARRPHSRSRHHRRVVAGRCDRDQLVPGRRRGCGRWRGWSEADPQNPHPSVGRPATCASAGLVHAPG